MIAAAARARDGRARRTRYPTRVPRLIVGPVGRAGAPSDEELKTGRAPSAPAARSSSLPPGTAASLGRCRGASPGSRRSGRGSPGTHERARTGRPSGQTRTSAGAAAASRSCRRLRAGARRPAERPATSASTHQGPAGSTEGGPLAVGVGEVRHAVRAHTAREGKCRAEVIRRGRRHGSGRRGAPRGADRRHAGAR